MACIGPAEAGPGGVRRGRKRPVDLVAAGARAAATVAELAREAEIIGHLLRDDKDVEQVLSGAGGILENARPNTVVLIHSTVEAGNRSWEWHERGKRKSMPSSMPA